MKRCSQPNAKIRLSMCINYALSFVWFFIARYLLGPWTWWKNAQSQPKVTPQRIKFQEIKEKEEEDAISSLPDYLLIEILSRLPSTKDAIGTGSLSKRWKHLWTFVHTLVFTYSEKDDTPRCAFISYVNKTLAQCRNMKLKKFKVHTGSFTCFDPQVNNWIRYAISCNAEELHLKLWCNSKTKFLLDQNFFMGSCFSDVTLEDCMLNPVGAISWKNLKSLSLSNVKVDEDLIENILSGSPLMETLVLEICYGYRRLNITSKSVKNLVFSGYIFPGYTKPDVDDDDDDILIIEINAPNIWSLTIKDSLVLWKLLLVNVSSVVEANLDYLKFGCYETTYEEEDEEMLKGFILNLHHVKELKFGDIMTEVLSRLEVQGFVFLSNIKFPSSWFDSDSDSAESGV